MYHTSGLFSPLSRDRSPRFRFRAFCKERALERLPIGAYRKELFYYLVNSHTEFSTSSSYRTRCQSGEDLPESERPSSAEVAKDHHRRLGHKHCSHGCDLLPLTQSGCIRALAGRSRWRLPDWRRTSERNEIKPDGMAKRLHVSVRRVRELGELTFTAANNNVFNRQSQGGRNTPWAKVKAQKCLENCKLNHSVDPMRPSRRLFLTVPRMRRIIPEETQLALHTYSVHLDPRNFHASEAFLPE